MVLPIWTDPESAIRVGRDDSPLQLGVAQRSEVESLMFVSRPNNEIDETFAVPQQHWETMRDLVACLIDLCQPCLVPARRRDAEQSCCIGKNDRPVAAPRAAGQNTIERREILRSPTPDYRNPLQSTSGAKRDKPAIGRPEWERRLTCGLTRNRQ
jgi:hypothetical protein